jgi:hypothetical protein
MAKFCNKCGSPVTGVFCGKCGADTRAAASPASQPAAPPVPSAPPAPEVSPMPAPVFSAPPPAARPVTRFCNKCGAPVAGRFCGKCGADALASPASVANSAPQSVNSPTPQPISGSATASPASTKGSPLTKILIGFAVVVITVGALAIGGVYYVVHRVKEKVHEVAQESGLSSDGRSSSSGDSVLGSISKAVSGSGSRTDSSGSGNNGGISGDPCRLLSKEEVGRSIGVQIVATQSADVGCSYLAQGDSGDMTSKHMAAMIAARGADAKTQQTIQSLTGGMAKMFQSEGHQETSDSNGNVPVFTFSVDNNAAEAQMRLNAKTLAVVSQQQGIPGIGDEAFDESGAMMLVRKGDKLIRIMYSTCPCSLDAIKPLAKKLADRV